MRHLIIITLSIIIFSCNPKTSEEYNAEAELLEQEGKFDQAIPLLDKAIEKDPNNLYALTNRAVDKTIIKDYNGAINDYSLIISIDSNNVLAYLNRGRNKIRIEQYYEATKDFDLALLKKISFIDTFKSKSPKEAMKMTKEIMKMSEFSATTEEILFSRGRALFEIDSLNSALNDFNNCIKMNYSLSDCYYWRAFVYINGGMRLKGCEDLHKSHELGDSFAMQEINKYCVSK
ncbi:MAG: hypothetical protein COB15_06820 [Flavobacteriales bacterium]|nr:MAG: hypothetical protein COB15_06820 [Flavobacteriales bacterium]